MKNTLKGMTLIISVVITLSGCISLRPLEEQTLTFRPSYQGTFISYKRNKFGVCDAIPFFALHDRRLERLNAEMADQFINLRETPSFISDGELADVV